MSFVLELISQRPASGQDQGLHPSPRALESFRQLDLRSPAEHGLRSADVEHACRHIDRSPGGVFHLHGQIDHLLELLYNLVQRMPAPGADVENPRIVGSWLVSGGLQERFYSVANVDVVPYHLAVALDGDRFALGDIAQKDANRPLL